jgi:hypothetical protein
VSKEALQGPQGAPRAAEDFEKDYRSLLPLAVVGSPEMGRAGVILVQALMDVGGRGVVTYHSQWKQ